MAVTENITATIAFPADSITSTLFSSTAGQELSASKVYHLHKIQNDFNVSVTGLPASGTEVFLHHARGAGTINKFWGLLYNDGTGTNISLVLKKNGSSIMSSTLSLTHTVGDGVQQLGSLTSSTYSAGDNFTAQLNIVSGSGGTAGPVAGLELVEKLDS